MPDKDAPRFDKTLFGGYNIRMKTEKQTTPEYAAVTVRAIRKHEKAKKIELRASFDLTFP